MTTTADPTVYVPGITVELPTRTVVRSPIGSARFRPHAPGEWDAGEIVEGQRYTISDRRTGDRIIEFKDADELVVTAANGPVPGEEIPWSGVVAIEDEWTGDGRFIEAGALTWADLPLPLMLDRSFLEGGEGHIGSSLLGRIDTLERVGNEIRGTGVIDATDDGREVARKIDAGYANGISIDPDQVEVAEYDEIEDGLRFSALRIRGATLTPFPAFVEATVSLDPTESETEAPEEPVAAASGGIVTRTLRRFTGPSHVDPAHVAAADNVRAKLDTYIRETLAAEEEAAGAVVAAAIPVDPPVEWFDDPEWDDLQQHTTCTPEGRISGHIAPLNECHIGYTRHCLTAAELMSDLRYFTTGYVRCAEGCQIPTGPLTLAGGHAPLHFDWRQAQQFYDDTNTAIADIAIGVDAHGIWFAGALRPGTTPAQIRTFLASGVSGDWRPIGNRRELVAVCACNTPGFPKALGVRVADGRLEALVASAAIEGSKRLRSKYDGWLNVALDNGTTGWFNPEAWEELEGRVLRLESKLSLLDPEIRRAAVASIGPPPRRLRARR